MGLEALVYIAGIVIGLPVVLGIGSDVLKRWIDHKERAMELVAGQAAEKAAQYAAQVERLEQRMRVLERIATDRGANLAMQIDDLRDDAPRGEHLQ